MSLIIRTYLVPYLPSTYFHTVPSTNVRVYIHDNSMQGIFVNLTIAKLLKFLIL